MKVALLGGSNSVKRFGLSSGLKENTNIEFYNFALGGSSCLQNLDAIISNYETMSTMDLIITESNINDFYNINTEVVSFELMKQNIAKYYSILSQLNVKVINLILPLNINFVSTKAIEIYNKVNQEHLTCNQYYGFYYINFQEFVSTFLSENKKLKLKKPLNLLLYDVLHPKSLFMHQVGLNISSYFFQDFSTPETKFSFIKLILKNFTFVSPPPSTINRKFNFIQLKAEEFTQYPLISQENSSFKQNMILIDTKVSFPNQYLGYKIIGVSTWGEGGLKLSNSTKNIIKNFNKYYTFNEIVEEFIIDDKTYMSNCDETITENSVNTPTKSSRKLPYVVGFLLENIENGNEIIPLKAKDDGVNLNFLLPNLEMYLYDSNDFVKKLTEEDIDIIRDTARLVEDINLNKAYKLMLIAHGHRPTGKHIQTKILQYRKKLNL